MDGKFGSAQRHVSLQPHAASTSDDTAAEIVRLAARLMRLQSRLNVEEAQHLEAGRSGRQAALRSGVEVIRGVAVSLVDEMRSGLERDAFHYAYQPIALADSGHIQGYEALLRWRRGTETLKPPLFLPLAEEARLLAIIQQRLLDAVAAQMHSRASASVSINWSPAQLCDQHAVSAFIDRVRQLSMEPSRIIIEITERSAVVDTDMALACASRLKDSGFRIALDDFGSGYCSFAYLCRLPIDIVKIDRSLIAEVATSPRAEIVLESIVHTAHCLGQQVVAEGIQTQQQWNIVRRLGCDLVQGYLVGPPAPADSAARGAITSSE